MKKLLLILFLFLTVNVFAQQGINDWVTGRLSYRDTIGTTVDTLSRHISTSTDKITASYWISGWVWASDTVQISDSISFNSSYTTILYPGEVLTFEKLSINAFNNLYFKSLFTGGHTGQATIRTRFYWK